MGFHLTFTDEKYGYEKVPMEVMCLIVERLKERSGLSETLRERLGASGWESALSIGHMFLESLSAADWRLVLEACEEVLPEARMHLLRQYPKLYRFPDGMPTEQAFERSLEHDEMWLKRVTEIVRELATEGSEESGGGGDSQRTGV